MTDPDPKDPPNDPPDPLETLQAEFTRIGAKELNRGANRGRKDVLKTLGFEGKTVEEATAELDALRTQTGDQTELQAKFTTTAGELATAQGQLKLANLKGDIMGALMEQGVKGERVAAAIKLVAAEISDLPSIPDSEGITAAVLEFKEGMPELFTVPGEVTDPNVIVPPKPGPATIPQVTGTGAGPAGSRGGTETPEERGSDMFEKLFAKELKANRATTP